MMKNLILLLILLTCKNSIAQIKSPGVIKEPSSIESKRVLTQDIQQFKIPCGYKSKYNCEIGWTLGESEKRKV